jgi:hypothetical protein
LLKIARVVEVKRNSEAAGKVCIRRGLTLHYNSVIISVLNLALKYNAPFALNESFAECVSV